MSELKPCPFCGANPVREYLPDGKEYIICSNENCPCQPMTAAQKSKGAAARAWNRRVNNEPKTIRQVAYVLWDKEK